MTAGDVGSAGWRSRLPVGHPLKTRKSLFRKQETSLYEKAEEYALKALQLKRDSLKHKGIVHSLLARIYETKSQYSKAISSLEEMIQANRKLKNWGFVSDGEKRLRRLREIERQR